MRLYPKKLHSIEELKREKAALLLRRKQTEAEDMFSMNDIIPSFGKKDKDSDKAKKEHSKEDAKEDGEGILGMLNNLADNVDIGSILSVVGAPIAGLASKKLRNSLIMPVAKELVGGYLKWKAAELSFKAAKHFVKKRKEKKEKEHNEE